MSDTMPPSDNTWLLLLAVITAVATLVMAAVMIAEKIIATLLSHKRVKAHLFSRELKGVFKKYHLVPEDVIGQIVDYHSAKMHKALKEEMDKCRKDKYKDG